MGWVLVIRIVPAGFSHQLADCGELRVNLIEARNPRSTRSPASIGSTRLLVRGQQPPLFESAEAQR